ncbi:MAG: ATP12 family protein [Alphaproteobacteria bacterium]
MKDSTGRRVARFYEAVAAATVEGGFTVLLDGHALKTPSKNPFRLPTEALAQAVVEEWLAQDENVEWAQMPLTRLAFSAIDRMPQFRELTIEEIVKYSQTDLVCYPVELPIELARRQVAAWRPLLIWFRDRFGVELAVANNVTPVDQSVGLETVLKTHIAWLDDMRLAVLYSTTASCGSIVLGLALLEGHLGAAEAFAASQIDESYQIERWGTDAESDARRVALQVDIEAGARFLELLAG